MRKGLILITLCFYGLCLHAQDVFNKAINPTAFTEDLRAVDFMKLNVKSIENLKKIVDYYTTTL